uniref:DUF2852 domain-containing protein n=2 Tax=Caenorhabditis tropicalis TaxID=1561998 RepID=A0A1I7U4X0_9PELO
MTYLIYMVLGSLTVFIIFHLLRRRPIEHFIGHEMIYYDRDEENELETLRNSRHLEQAKLLSYTKRTNHVATSTKIRATVARDFEAFGVSDEELAKKEKVIIQRIRLRKGPLDEEEEP